MARILVYLDKLFLINFRTNNIAYVFEHPECPLLADSRSSIDLAECPLSLESRRSEQSTLMSALY